MSSPTNALVVVDSDREFLPVLTIERAVERFGLMREFVQKIMRPKIDYGVIPGTDNKNTLLKAGAEKLCTFFGLRKEIAVVKEIEDWTGAAHNGEPFFYYLYRVSLYRGEVLVASGDGSANSWEKKYRWRTADRVCPECGAAAIKRSKYPPRDDPEGQPGWYCFAKAGGCGANFYDDDDRIVGQKGGKVANPDVADSVNAIQKIALKRALVAATLLGVNASDYFTQDLEETTEDHPEPAAEAPPAETPVAPPRPAATREQTLRATAARFKREWRLPQLVATFAGPHQAIDQLTDIQARTIQDRLALLHACAANPPADGVGLSHWIEEVEAHLAHEGCCAGDGEALAELCRAGQIASPAELTPWPQWKPEHVRWGWQTITDWARSRRTAQAAPPVTAA